jgi:hypothetical protein
MSEKLSRLAEGDQQLVLDASAILNLLGSSDAEAILTALRRSCVAESIAWREIQRDPITRQPPDASLGLLSANGLLIRQEMSEDAKARFMGLALAEPPDGLGDGEAASIALAEALGAGVVLDERKATRICADQLKSMRVFSTMDLLSHASVSDALGQSRLGDAVYSALLHARMRVPPEFAKWTIKLIGPDRARTCPSISRYLK